MAPGTLDLLYYAVEIPMVGTGGQDLRLLVRRQSLAFRALRIGASVHDGLHDRRSVCAVAGRWQPESGPEGFIAATVDQAYRVLDAEEGWPTYDAGLEFQGLAMSAMSETPDGKHLPDIPAGLYLIWGALTDEMDAPGRGSLEQDAAAVRHMKQAAAEWLAVVDAPDPRAAYLDRWVHDECGYERNPS